MATSASASSPFPASPFVRLLACSGLASVMQAGWLMTFSVYLADKHRGLPASTIAAATVAGSYLLSVLLDRWSSVRGLRFALAFSALGFSLLTRLDPIAVLLLSIGMGLSRSSYQRLVADLRPQGMTVSRAFAVYSVVVNLAYFLGGLGADLLRLSLGWGGFFFTALCFMSLSLVTSSTLSEPQTEQRHADEPIHLGLPAWGLLASVATYFLASAQFQTVLPLVVEAETRPQGWLKAGTLGAVHGLAVMSLTLGQSARIGSHGSPLVLASGIAMIGFCFCMLAAMHYPTTPNLILVVVALMAAGETLVAAHMQALGSRLAGAVRSGYWFAAAVGYLLSAAWGVEWSALSHARFFAVIAASCVAVSCWVLFSFRSK